jgi:hypothetical protein
MRSSVARAYNLWLRPQQRSMFVKIYVFGAVSLLLQYPPCHIGMVAQVDLKHALYPTRLQKLPYRLSQ